MAMKSSVFKMSKPPGNLVISSMIDGTDRRDRAPTDWIAAIVNLAVGITEAGGSTKGIPMDSDNDGANRPNPYSKPLNAKEEEGLSSLHGRAVESTR